MTSPPRFALNSASNPDQLLSELEKFIVFWLGPRKEEFGVPADVLDRYQLPTPLRRLYAFAGHWKRLCRYTKLEEDIFSLQEHLRPPDRVEPTPDGKLIFVDENQGNWTCATLPEGQDPPVWVEDVFNNYGQEKWALVTESLSQFLVTFCLCDLLFGSNLHLTDKGLERWFQSSMSEAIPLWSEGVYPNWGEKFSFYLVGGSVLVGNLGGGISFGANDDEGKKFLKSRQGDIRLLGLSRESSWSLDIKPDGSAKLTYPNRFDSSALAPAGTFDFASVRDQLRSACTGENPKDDQWYVWFLRAGQTSVLAQGIDDARLVGLLFRRALEALTSKEAAFDDLMREFPLRIEAGD